MIFWKISEKYLPKGEYKILEVVDQLQVLNLLNFIEKMGYEPYGIDYSFYECELNEKSSDLIIVILKMF